MSTYLGAEMFKDRTGSKVQVVLRLQISQQNGKKKEAEMEKKSRKELRRNGGDHLSDSDPQWQRRPETPGAFLGLESTWVSRWQHTAGLGLVSRGSMDCGTGQELVWCVVLAEVGLEHALENVFKTK